MFNISINNFRGFKEKKIGISNVNILIGENSGGKSSFIKLLLLLKQSMESPNKNKKIMLDGHLLDLGNFDSFINHNSDDKTFSVSITTGDEYIDFFIEGMTDADKSADDFKEECKNYLTEPTVLTFTFDKDDNEIFTNNIKIFNKAIGTLTFNITDKLHKDFSDMEDINGEVILEHIKYNKIVIKDKLSVVGFMLWVTPDPIIKYDEENKTNLFNEFAFLLFSQNYLAMILRSNI